MIKGKLFVFSGPSGVGKSTIRTKIIDESQNIWYSISLTTRIPRADEKNGKDYYFITKEEFINHINNDSLIEYAEVYNGDFYGTPKDSVLKKLNIGINVILEIDVEGALIIKEKYPEAILIFIMAPTMEELERRLVSRYTDTREKIKERLEKAEIEITFKNKYDYIVVNHTIDETVDKIKTIIDLEQNKENLWKN